MKLRLFILAMVFAVTRSASAYTVTPVTKAPDWQVDWTFNQSRPDWQAPSATDYSNFTVMFIKLEEALQPYASKDDLMAIFVGDELRGVAGPAHVVGNPGGTVAGSGSPAAPTTFVLKAFSNEGNGDVIDLTLKYYNAQLKQIFTRSNTITYDMEEVFGIEEDFIPEFTLGSPKYPVVTTIDVAPMLSALNIDPADGDIVTIFVGDECRGVQPLPLQDAGDLTVYGRKEGETFTLKYYDADKQRVLTYTLGRLPIGDANGDKAVNVADISYIITLMTGYSGDIDITDADVNKDGAVDVADIATIISIMAAQ